MIGQSFGNYRAIALLGEGGMGAVYLAEHPGIGRRVAVKVLHKSLILDAQLMGRFLNEARTANAIRHPNIIEILDSGTLADGMPYLVMELLEGETLGARIARLGRLPTRAALRFAFQTASALGAAHDKGIVHRDLKPDNLFIVPDPGHVDGERLKVLDFGIAKLQESASNQVKTRTGAVLGTPLYMSPEQCRGVREIDHRSDIYSLGIILYEMVTGRPPFVSEGFGDLVNMHLNLPVPDLRQAAPETPAMLEALIMKSLAKNPEDRYPNMAAVREALRRVPGGALATAASFPDGHASHINVGRTTPLSDRGGATVSGAAGEVQAAPGGRRLWTGAVAVAMLAVAGIFGARAALREKPSEPPSPSPVATGAVPAPPAPAPAPPPAPPAVVVAGTAAVRLTSSPAGALVVNNDDGATLGRTPVTISRPVGERMSIHLELKGYTPEQRALVIAGDEDLSFTMRPVSGSPPGPRPARHKKPREEEPAKL
jgi:serine/threonine-protein kinase